MRQTTSISCAKIASAANTTSCTEQAVLLLAECKKNRHHVTEGSRCSSGPLVCLGRLVLVSRRRQPNCAGARGGKITGVSIRRSSRRRSGASFYPASRVCAAGQRNSPLQFGEEGLRGGAVGHRDDDKQAGQAPGANG